MQKSQASARERRKKMGAQAQAATCMLLRLPVVLYHNSLHKHSSKSVLNRTCLIQVSHVHASGTPLHRSSLLQSVTCDSTVDDQILLHACSSHYSGIMSSCIHSACMKVSSKWHEVMSLMICMHERNVACLSHWAEQESRHTFPIMVSGCPYGHPIKL